MYREDNILLLDGGYLALRAKPEQFEGYNLTGARVSLHRSNFAHGRYELRLQLPPGGDELFTAEIWTQHESTRKLGLLHWRSGGKLSQWVGFEETGRLDRRANGLLDGGRNAKRFVDDLTNNS